MAEESTAGKAPLEPVPRRVAEIDWPHWRAVDRATLCFVVEQQQILLIRKKRGLGAGKINGPGGRIETGETPLECAVREVEEELLITPTGLVECGQLRFQFVDGYSLHVWVFRASGHRGEAGETAEAIPLWTPLEAIPYDEMWADDRLWLPRMLASERIDSRSIFDGDRMLDFDFDFELTA